MYLSELLTAELHALADRIDHPVIILETGSIRSGYEQYRLNDGWSTLTFAEWVAERGGRAISVDLDTTAAELVLRTAGLRDHVDLIRGDSLDTLHDLIYGGDPPRVDLLFLDSANDGDLTFKEYMLGRQLLSRPAVVIVDDVDLSDPNICKGDDLIPYLASQGVPYRLARRNGTTYSTGVLIVEEGPS
jgi:Methyltransferase domain